MKTPLRIVSISDIHLGNNKVDIGTLAYRLDKYLVPKIKDCDLLVLGGDILDMILSFDHKLMPMLLDMLLQLLREANKYNVVVRLIRGTYSHDRNQLSNLVTLHHACNLTNDFKYFDKIDVEYIPSLDVKLLYLPDDLPYGSSDAVIDVVKALLAGNNWDGVDYAVVHGNFTHVYPENIASLPKILYTHEQFSFVKRYVLVGHVHTGSIYENIIYNGSFDRLRHNEEEDKGYIYIIDDGVDAKIQFIKNEDATPFITLDLSKYEDIDEAISTFTTLFNGYDVTNRVHHIRVIHPSAEIRKAIGRVLKTYPNVVYTHKGNKNIVNIPVDREEDIDIITLPAPTKENLGIMILEHIKLKDANTTLALDALNDILNMLGE